LGRFIKFITFIKRSLEAFLLTDVALPPLAVLYGGKFQMSSLLLNEMWLDFGVWFYTYRIFG
jgi:hypothetical protein